MERERSKIVYQGIQMEVGMKAALNRDTSDNSVRQCEPITIVAIKSDDGSGKFRIGICGEYHDHWHDLEGRCENGHGYWLTSDQAIAWLVFEPRELTIIKEYKFKGRNLRGMKCRNLSHMSDGSIFIEAEENIGGTSCDGMGKRGHCIIVDPEIVGMKRQKIPKNPMAIPVKAKKSKKKDDRSKRAQSKMWRDMGDLTQEEEEEDRLTPQHDDDDGEY